MYGRPKHNCEPEEGYYDDYREQMLLRQDREEREAEKADSLYNEMKEDEILKERKILEERKASEECGALGDFYQRCVDECEALSKSINDLEDVVFKIGDLLSVFSDRVEELSLNAEEARRKILYPDEKSPSSPKPDEEDCPF